MSFATSWASASVRTFCLVCGGRIEAIGLAVMEEGEGEDRGGKEEAIMLNGFLRVGVEDEEGKA